VARDGCAGSVAAGQMGKVVASCWGDRVHAAVPPCAAKPRPWRPGAKSDSLLCAAVSSGAWSRCNSSAARISADGALSKGKLTSSGLRCGLQVESIIAGHLGV
jgi:hypothetical protein